MKFLCQLFDCLAAKERLSSFVVRMIISDWVRKPLPKCVTVMKILLGLSWGGGQTGEDSRGDVLVL